MESLATSFCVMHVHEDSREQSHVFLTVVQTEAYSCANKSREEDGCKLENMYSM